MTTWWVTNILSDPGRGPVFLAVWLFWVISSIVLHELAHGWAAIRKGDPTPMALGHMTWNPAVHIPPMAFVALALVGVTWGLMPINPSRMRGRHAHAYVAFAGPFANLAIAAACILLGALWSAYGHTLTSPTAQANGTMFFLLGAGLNLILCAFNLVPAPPLDGSVILASFVRPYRRLLDSEHGQVLSIVAFVAAFFLLAPVIAPRGFALASDAIAAVASLLPQPPPSP